MDTPAPENLCSNCGRPMAAWPSGHDGYRGVAPVSPADSSSRGDKFTCHTTLCNRYGMVVRVHSQEMSQAG
jgi:hypothetical protein